MKLMKKTKKRTRARGEVAEVVEGGGVRVVVLG
jgi:hypothetical protein